MPVYLNIAKKKKKSCLESFRSEIKCLVYLAHRKGSINVTSLITMTIIISLDIQCTLHASHHAGAGDRWRADRGLFLPWLRRCQGRGINMQALKNYGKQRVCGMTVKRHLSSYED